MDDLVDVSRQSGQGLRLEAKIGAVEPALDQADALPRPLGHAQPIQEPGDTVRGRTARLGAGQEKDFVPLDGQLGRQVRPQETRSAREQDHRYRKFSLREQPWEKTYFRKVTPFVLSASPSSQGSISAIARRIFPRSAGSVWSM